MRIELVAEPPDRDFVKKARCREGECLVFANGRGPVGCAWGGTILRRGERTYWVSDIAVEADVGKAEAQKISRLLYAWARRRGCTVVEGKSRRSGWSRMARRFGARFKNGRVFKEV